MGNDSLEACRRIAEYMDPEELREKCEELYGLPFEEALEMAYENVLREARSGAKTTPRRRRKGAADA